MRGLLLAPVLVLLGLLAAIPFAEAQQNPIGGRANNGCVPIPGYTYMIGQPAPAMIDVNTGSLCVDGPGSGGNPTPVVPGQLTYLGKQTFSAATLASPTTLIPPAGALIADFYPECTTNGTNNQCVRYDPTTTANNATSAGLASQQLMLGFTGPLATTQVILAAGAAGATGNTLTVYYYK